MFQMELTGMKRDFRNVTRFLVKVIIEVGATEPLKNMHSTNILIYMHEYEVRLHRSMIWQQTLLQRPILLARKRSTLTTISRVVVQVQQRKSEFISVLGLWSIEQVLTTVHIEFSNQGRDSRGLGVEIIVNNYEREWMPVNDVEWQWLIEEEWKRLMHADEAVSSKQTCSQTPSKLQFVLRLLEWYCGSLSTRSGVVYDWLGLYTGLVQLKKTLSCDPGGEMIFLFRWSRVPVRTLHVMDILKLVWNI